jgi:flagellar FliJ protein
MAFRFGLESVLKHRKRLEEVAQREFAEAQAAVDECLMRIDAMYTRMDEVREEIHDAQNDGSAARIEQVREMESFLGGHKIRIEALRLEARRLLQIAEEKQELLIEAAKEKKILVKLREKRLAEYREWLKQVEAKELDDLTMVRRAWVKK